MWESTSGSSTGVIGSARSLECPRAWETMKRTFALLALCAIWVNVSADDRSDEIPLEKKIAIIAGDYSDDAEKRLRFTLPRLVRACSDVPNKEAAGDMLYVAHTKLGEAGLSREENLLEMIDNAYSFTMKISAQAEKRDIPLKCAEIWSMYVILRREGHSIDEAKQGLVELTTTLYCQSALNIDPPSASKIDPPEQASGGRRWSLEKQTYPCLVHGPACLKHNGGAVYKAWISLAGPS